MCLFFRDRIISDFKQFFNSPACSCRVALPCHCCQAKHIVRVFVGGQEGNDELLQNLFCFFCFISHDSLLKLIPKSRKKENDDIISSPFLHINLYSSCKINREKRALELIMSIKLQLQCQGWLDFSN